MKSRVVRYKELWVHGISVLKKRWPFTAPSVWIWFDGNQLCAKVVTDEEIQNIDEERKDYTTTLVNDVITATLPEKSKEGFILAFQELIEKGIPKKAWHILYNCSDLRLASKRFPAMTDEELEKHFIGIRIGCLPSLLTYLWHGILFLMMLWIAWFLLLPYVKRL